MTNNIAPAHVAARVRWLVQRGRRAEAAALASIEWRIPRAFFECVTEYAREVDALTEAIGNITLPIFERLLKTMERNAEMIDNFERAMKDAGKRIDE